jgi:phenylpropionate dioxygenase-like ring-hydroxylating dioxygenase large terminal subunit
MRCEPHPISGFIYQEVGGGLVRVEDREHGPTGLFRWDGTWIEGDLTHADPHLLNYVGGPNVPPEHDVYWLMLPLDHDGTRPALPDQEAVHAAQAAAAEMPRLVAKYVPDPGIQTPDGMRSVAYIDQAFLLENDRHPELIPDAYRLKSPPIGGPQRLRVDRYFKREFHDLEVERLWKKTWQMACREDEIPEVGDHYLYRIAHLSFLVVRTGPDEFKAHYNACLHRGRQLRDCSGRKAHEFRCPFHGWTWTIDGKLKHITTEWDFPGVRENVATLAGAKVGRWGGWIFINPDPKAISLEEFMGPEMRGHYAKFRYERRHLHAHVQKVIRANWKVTMEAFSESYHVLTTHPQLLLQGGDYGDSHYDVFGNWARLGHVQSPGASAMRGIVPTPEEALALYRSIADRNKAFLESVIGDEADQFSDAELNDITYSSLFPNFAPWGGFGRIVYRWRPNGDNPEECIMELMLLAPWPEGKPKPPPARLHELGPDEPWAHAPELGNLGRIIDQDMINLDKVQLGLKTKPDPYVWLSAYQEGVLRHWHQTYARMLGLEELGLE